MDQTQEPGAPPPFKKRKFYRKRPEYEDQALNDNADEESASSAPPTELLTVDEMISQSRSDNSQTREELDTPLSVAELLRQRKVLQRRKGGIGFANSSDATDIRPTGPQQTILGTGEEEKALSKFVTVVDRFAPQTGQVADVDQHMYAIPLTHETDESSL